MAGESEEATNGASASIGWVGQSRHNRLPLTLVTFEARGGASPPPQCSPT